MTKVLLLGESPLPCENPRTLSRGAVRSWHFAKSLLREGHHLLVIGLRRAGQEDERSEHVIRAELPTVLPESPAHWSRRPSSAYYSFNSRRLNEQRGSLLRLASEFGPECIVGVGQGSLLAAWLPLPQPLWADLPWLMAASSGYRTLLARGDFFSAPASRQRFMLIGELAAAGRIKPATWGHEFVQVIPHSVDMDERSEPARKLLRGSQVGEGDLVALWSGSYDSHSDAETLFEALSWALGRNPRLRFVSLGGAAGRSTCFQRLRERVAHSDLAERFSFLGWVPTDQLAGYYRESDLGICLDRPGLAEACCRSRLVGMMAAGMPVVITQGSEMAQWVQAWEMGAACAPGDPKSAGQAVLELASQPELRRKMGANAARFAGALDLHQTTSPLKEWVAHPRPAPDRKK